ncbi:MAG: hypothetical protein JRI68_27250 [Deltaproteobacteria bacterium]|nr:hypothetical protein [Deltaproteobacteria bacterium]
MGSFTYPSNRVALWAGGLLLANLLTAGGCGGKAVVDPAATGTGGTTSTSSGTGGTTSSTSTSTSTTSTSGTGGGPGSLCMEACSKIDVCLSVGTDCVDGCQDAMDSCVPQQDDYLMCVIDSATGPSCGPLPQCAEAMWDFLQCKDIQDVGGGCGMNPNGDCECQIEDNHNNLYEAYCTSSEGQNKCECFFNYEPVGQCSFTGPEDCYPLDNCCAPLFFVPALPG